MPIAAIATRTARAAATLVLAVLLGSALVELSPGGDAEDLDPRLSRESAEVLRQRRRLWWRDAGVSRVFGQPIGELIRERVGQTTVTVAGGLVAGWAAALAVAAGAAATRHAFPGAAAVLASGTLLSCPSAVLAVLCLLAGLPPAAAIAAVIFPRVFSHAYEQFRHGLTHAHVTMARALGMSERRIFLRHVAPDALPPLIALAGVSVTLAAGAAIPVEAMADSPGLGKLAWRAALGRDVPLLVTTTLLLAAITVAANLVCEIAVLRLTERRA